MTNRHAVEYKQNPEIYVITTPFSDLESWVSYFRSADIPVLKHTVTELDKLRGKADSVNAREVSSIVMSDPLMALRLLAFVELHRQKRQITDITTIERVILMIGMEPFFKEFEHIPYIEDQLLTNPKSLLALLKIIQRNRKAAYWAREWALVRKDLEVEEIMLAALLHDASELLVWAFAPELAQKVKSIQTADKHVRSKAAQMQILGITYHDLQISLTQALHLPELLTRLMNHSDGETSHRELNVRLAADLARHSANGWDDAALPDDYDAICKLLHMDQETLLRRLNVPAQTD
ncbi:MAG TPA: HDOD domain-containing protein [Rhodocyclaceae bacterium]|nr:HDOD domain-containing protein [Rhodocyclaceae bacterium]